MKKVLIIEDEMALINNLTFALSDEFEVLSATTGAEGLRKARKEKPDLVLLDIMLPDKSGIEILQELKKDEATNDIKVVVMTNLGDKETISKILQAGGKDYLVKADWSIDDIAKKIKKILK
ncbi:MAG: hypothetical protein A3J62_00985 [Candidatus Buchananbacteria bacterium RIFCSPHIGHO2_02_FULL_38_8]|uniref:Response regulatory domain-containing protein n=2 Tax=Candidatus Buchananiibacteriota TaxID=1817903 RepID=A0A1G1XU36_9BACT|nr:MAG: hypothetical protein A2731_01050 [Candidatus Buchananbacteria bacterium RIFCSPHIGHO2_01_FULL_39_8]OGY47769.1 MAG: hypothetical protein A3J62_00985 [Candidatus Buchananbacteria bacterium RIFCSPHIGHO2_02_FULL_38_8]